MTKKFRKYGIILLAFTVTASALFLTGCGKDAEKTTSEEVKAEITAQTATKNDLTDQKEEVIRSMEKELENAKTPEEKEQIKAKYEEKINKIDKEIAKVESDISKKEEKFETAKKEEAKKEEAKKDEPKKEESKKPANDAKPSVKPDSKPSQGGGTAVKPDTKPTPKPEAKPQPKPEVKPDTGKKPEQNNKPAEKPKEPVLVKPAWDEEVDDLDLPIYEEIDKWWIEFRDGTEKWYYDEDEWYDAYADNPKAGSWGGPEVEYKLIGYHKKIIHHEAIYEYR